MPSKGSSPAGNTTVTSNQAPWAAQQTYLESLFSNASNLLANNPQQYYPGQTVSNLMPQTYQGLNLTADLGAFGTPELSAAEQGLTQELGAGTGGMGPGGNPGYSNLEPFSSGMLMANSNPYFQGMFDTAVNNTMPSTVAPFIGAGRGAINGDVNGAEAQAITGAIQNAGNTLSYQNYENMAPLTLQGANDTGQLWNTGNTNINFGSSIAPSLTNQDFTNASNLAGVGTTLQNQNQNYINEDMARFNANQGYPWSTLGNFSSLIGNPTQGTGSTTSPYFTNPTANAIATGSGLLGLANGIGGTNGMFPGAISGLFGGGGSTAGISSALDAIQASSAAAAAGGGGLSGLFGLAATGGKG